jgi:hypothetical protein
MTSTKIGRLAAALLATVALGWGGPFSVASLPRELREGRAIRFAPAGPVRDDPNVRQTSS